MQFYFFYKVTERELWGRKADLPGPIGLEFLCHLHARYFVMPCWYICAVLWLNTNLYLEPMNNHVLKIYNHHHIIQTHLSYGALNILRQTPVNKG